MIQYSGGTYVQHKEVIVPDDVEMFVLGDIHGCFDMMMDSLKLAGYQPNRGDYVFCVGDLIDRGPDNLKVLATFMYNPRFHSVMGNHDLFMASDDYQNWMANGGIWIINDGYDVDTILSIGEEIRKYLPVLITVRHRGKTYGIVHGGVNPSLTLSWDELVSTSMNENIMLDLLWDRRVIEQCDHSYNLRLSSLGSSETFPLLNGVDFVFHGHNYTMEPFLEGNRVFLDTGGVFNGKMTCCRIDSDDVLTTFTTDPEDSCGDVRVL